MSVYSSTNTLHYKAGNRSSRFSQKRSLRGENTQQIEMLLQSDALDIQSRSGQAIMNSPPNKIGPTAILCSGVTRHYVTTQEQAIWHYLLRPGRFFFIWLFLGLLAALS